MDSGPVMETSEEGSAFYGDVRIVEGSGTVTRDAQHRGGQPGAMDLQLCAEVAGLGDADARRAPLPSAMSSCVEDMWSRKGSHCL